MIVFIKCTKNDLPYVPHTATSDLWHNANEWILQLLPLKTKACSIL